MTQTFHRAFRAPGFLLVMLLLLQACAVPVPPTGGPPDSTPPALVSSEPATGSVNVDTDRLLFEFSEPIDRASFLSAFSITPEMNGTIEVGGSSRRVEVRLPEALREGTTYRVTLDVSLRDQRRVTLSTPITLAFATGPEIDRARLSGRMVLAMDGSGVSGLDVLAFADADSASLAAAPLYRTQTGGEGRFTLDYLPHQSFFVVGLRDANRNRLIDEGEWIAVPPVPSIQADTSAATIDTPWILADHDHTPPSVDRVRAISESEIEIRLSEALKLYLDQPMPDGHDLMLSDSSGTQRVDVQDVWFRQDRPRILYASAPGLTPGGWQLEGSLALTDSVGNPVEGVRSGFVVPEGLPAPDPVDLLRWTPDSLDVGDGAVRTVWPVENPGVRFTRPDPDISIVFADTSGTTLSMTTRQGDATWFTWTSDQEAYRVSVDWPGADSTRTVQLRGAAPRELGALGMVVDPGEVDASSIRAHLFPVDAAGQPLAEAVLDDDLLLFGDLPGGFRGRIMVFVDRDGDGRWSPGSLLPYEPAEMVRWHAFAERVRPRWDTIASDTLVVVPTSTLNPNE